MNFLKLLSIVAPVFIVVGVGFLLRRVRWMSPAADETLLRLVLNILFPAFIADSILGNPLLARPSDLWFPPVVAFTLITLSMGLIALLLAPLRLPAATSGAGMVTAGVQNYGYIVMPLVQALFDKDTLGVLFLHNVGVDIGMWSLGAWVLTRGHGTAMWRRILNVPVFAILCSCSLNLLHAQEWMPEVMRKSLHLLGQAAVPLALLFTGATLCDQLRERSQERPRYAALSLALGARLILLPLLFLAVARWIPMQEALRRIIVLQAAMPAAMMPVVLCRLYNADSRFCIQIIMTSTVISIFTIPLWIRFGLDWIAR